MNWAWDWDGALCRVLYFKVPSTPLPTTWMHLVTLYWKKQPHVTARTIIMCGRPTKKRFSNCLRQELWSFLIVWKNERSQTSRVTQWSFWMAGQDGLCSLRRLTFFEKLNIPGIFLMHLVMNILIHLLIWSTSCPVACPVCPLCRFEDSDRVARGLWDIYSPATATVFSTGSCMSYSLKKMPRSFEGFVQQLMWQGDTKFAAQNVSDMAEKLYKAAPPENVMDWTWIVCGRTCFL